MFSGSIKREQWEEMGSIHSYIDNKTDSCNQSHD